MLAVKLEDLSRGLLERTLLARLGDASAALLAQHLALQLMNEHRIVVQTAVNDAGVLKIMPPLTVQREQIDRFVAALDAVLENAGHAKAIAGLALEVLRRKTQS
jgi:acetylornithine/succinyldiaminopimelate/putrescine aminotransferase